MVWGPLTEREAEIEAAGATRGADEFKAKLMSVGGREPTPYDEVIARYMTHEVVRLRKKPPYWMEIKKRLAVAEIKKHRAATRGIRPDERTR